ncbi:hypothetical protein [uncultured Devosia sp.]|uniref:hypothetical protein n=1 Tax=uncultured Devosia sp. TaxID=211434 RepID=UPI0035CB3D6E
MQVKTLVSIIALGTALAFAGPAAAQTIDGVTISADDLPKVQARCDELANAGATESLTESSDDSDMGSEDSADTDDNADATITNPPQVNGTDESTVTSVDLNTLTIESCTTGGLVTGQ